MSISEKITIAFIFLTLGALVFFTQYPLHERMPSSIVETRSEHLVFEDEGCRIFQVRIEDKDGLRHIYVAVPHPDKHGRYTTSYARCQVTAH